MNWNNLLLTQRTGQKQLAHEQYRSAFEQDYDRIIFSHPFRRLQDKTQVHPLPEHDFVHTRLTHSLEVSSVGRSLGKRVGEVGDSRSKTGNVGGESSVPANAKSGGDSDDKATGEKGEVMSDA